MSQTVFPNLGVPFVGPIKNNLQQGTVISISGTSFQSANRVCVNLQVGPNIAPRDPVALHVALDFTRNAIIRNSIQSSNWGNEESFGSPISLIRGQYFTLDILCDAYDYKIAYNGTHYTEMKHRMPFQSVSYLAIDGDFQMQNLRIQTGGNGSAMPTPGFMPMPGQPGNVPTTGHMSMPGPPLGCIPNSPNYSAYPGQTHYSPYLQKNTGSPIKDAMNTGLTNYALTGHLSPKKAAKAHRKQLKKAAKYGVPIAATGAGVGVGMGAYALHKAHKKHKHKGYKHHKSSSSSSSSSSD
ncbi:galectin-4-like [Daktulosphaira vitifoliae]|uniref:galectin-4-like n=1 Tax=Daktulosphaira vitifoliae TaxID=58002 RepID=UPI0021AA99C1|nr:galectin-4-like [Daktulosphaira vitifoliae]